MIKAVISGSNSLLAVRMTIAQMDPDNEWRPTHIMRIQNGSWGHMWETIDDPTMVQDPTFTFDEEAARALYDAMAVFYGDTLRKPVIVINTGELNDGNLQALGDTITKAIKEASK